MRVTLPIPLLQPDLPVMLDLGAVLRTIYERARYNLRVDYGKPPLPRLSEQDTSWAASVINGVGFQSE